MSTKMLLTKRKEVDNFRALRIEQGLIDFSSNDYLGLARSKHLKRATLSECESFDSLGSTGSRLLTGNSAYFENLEAQIATFHGFETGLIFNCGYMANIGLLSSIAEEGDTILFDSHIHASTHEGIRLSKAQSFPFRHNNLDHLEARLKQTAGIGNVYICIESIYSTDGSIAPLSEIFALSLRYPSRLIVDEAHAIGIVGHQGKGAVYEAGLSGKIFAQTITFSKALGTFGAIVLGNQYLKKILVNFAKPFIYTTALSFLALASIKCSYDLFPYLEKERGQLQDLIQLANCSCTSIQPIPVGGNREAHRLVAAAKQKGFNIRALLSPTVQRGKEIVRLTLHAFNSREELLDLLALVRKYG